MPLPPCVRWERTAWLALTLALLAPRVCTAARPGLQTHPAVETALQDFLAQWGPRTRPHRHAPQDVTAILGQRRAVCACQDGMALKQQ